MAELACNMVYVYLAGAWSWLNRATAARDRLTFRECSKRMGHDGPHMPGLTTEHPDPAAQEDLDRLAGYRPPTYAELDRLRVEPDPERDRRREAYRALEREKARRALDAYFQAVDEKDWPLANELSNRVNVRMGEYTASPSHHNRSYGIPPESCYGGEHGDQDVSGVSEG